MIRPTFNFELRDFGAALAKDEMRSRDKSREVGEHLEGEHLDHLEGETMFEKESVFAFEPYRISLPDTCFFGLYSVQGVVTCAQTLN